jgi:hypothetical protein
MSRLVSVRVPGVRADRSDGPAHRAMGQHTERWASTPSTTSPPAHGYSLWVRLPDLLNLPELPRPQTIRRVVLAFIALITFISLSDNHAPSSLPRSALSFAKQRLPGFGEIGNPGRRWGGSDDGTCFAWDPHGLEEDDPPDCLRARQFRQVKKVRKANPQ